MANQIGLSSRGIGMANAVSAVIDDYAAVYYNPAGLALKQGNELAAGYCLSYPKVHVRNEARVEHVLYEKTMNAGVLAYRQDLRGLLPERWERNIGLGVVAAFQNDLKGAALLQTSFYNEMQFPVFGRDRDILVAAMGLGAQLHRCFYIGAGLRGSVMLDVKDVSVLVNLSKFDIEIQNLDANVETEFRPIVGIILKPWEPVFLAAVWRGGGTVGNVEARGSGSVQLGDSILPVSSISLTLIDFYSPDEIAGSIAYQPMEKLLLSLEVTYARWSPYNVPFDKEPPGKPFRDIIIPRLGMEYLLLRWMKIQMGYYYQPSPVRATQPFTQFLDADEHVFSTAMECSWPVLKCILNAPLKFHLYFQYQYLPSRSLDTVNGRTTIWGYIANFGASVHIPF